MKQVIRIAESKTPGGGTMTLFEHDGAYSINLDGLELMQSRACTSELLLGELGVARLDSSGTGRVLIGGLGLGYTLKSALAAAGKRTTVEVAELIPDVIEWNRVHLQALNGGLLEDPRVVIRVEDVSRLIREVNPGTYDAIMLDVDNGPVALVADNNTALYTSAGLHAVQLALKPGGRAVFWSARKDPKFESRLYKAGFKVNAVPAKIYEKAKKAAYLLYVADTV